MIDPIPKTCVLRTAIAIIIAHVAAPSSAQNGWTQLRQQPSTQGVLAYDSQRNVLVFAGESTHERQPNGAWTLVEQNGILGSALAYDSNAGVCVTVDINGDTWTWDGQSWTLAARAASGPPLRTWYGLTYDARRQRTVLHGGTQSTGLHLNDTWEWDGATWSQVSSAGPMTAQHDMVYDEVRQQVVLFGGGIGLASTSELFDTWAWNGQIWARLATTGPPSSRGAMAYDIIRDRTVYVTPSGLFRPPPTVWEWDGVAWTLVATLSGLSPGQLFETRSAAFDPNVPGFVTVTDELEGSWNGTNWSQTVTTRPNLSTRTAALFDRSQGIAVFATTGMSYEWDGTNWGPPAIGPNARFPVLVYDPVRAARIWIDESRGVQALEWSNGAWNRVIPTSSSNPQGAVFASAWDPVHNQVLVYLPRGGSSSSPTTQTWHWDGAAWSQTTANTGPSGSEFRLVTDTKRQKIVLWNGANATSGETWEWDGARWTRVSIRGPGILLRPAMVYDEVRERTMLFGGSGNVGQSIWEWDGRRWRQLDEVSFYAFNGTAGVFDPGAGRVIALGPTDELHQFDYDAVGPSCITGASGTPAVLTLQDGRPAVGTTIEAALRDLPPSATAASGLLGIRTPLQPIALDTLGLLGCELQLAEALIASPLSLASGAATWRLSIPNDPSLSDLRVFLQAVLSTPNANGLGITLSNAAAVVIR